ncbi:MAG: hypothetical protein NC331_06350 [Lachnospiraceae bacterium]|nr:hypothetical protein [Lachnospiraceae bacterium]MCM1238991.1 hypothetical protein [Lachnospiraceae bacterium]
MGKITFHVVHSVKGGCGKTAFSLFKALGLAKKAIDNGEDHARVLLLDADLLGSGLKTLLYVKDEKTFETNKDTRLEAYKVAHGGPGSGVFNYLIFQEKYQKCTLNQFLMDDDCTFLDIYVEGAAVHKADGEEITPDTEINGFIDFVFCAPEGKDKNYFRYQNGNTPSIDMGRYRLKIRQLLTEIHRLGETGKKGKGADNQKIGYEHVVIDMPPGYDQYSSVLLEVLREFVKKEKVKDEIYYYALTTGDRSHLDAMMENVLEMLAEDSLYDPYEKVFAVFNETQEAEYIATEPQDVIEDLKRRADESLGMKNKVEGIVCKFQKEYNAFCRMDSRPTFGYSLNEMSGGLK